MHDRVQVAHYRCCDESAVVPALGTFVTASVLYELHAVVHYIGWARGEHCVVIVFSTDDKWRRHKSDRGVIATVGADTVLTSGAYILSHAKRLGGGLG